MSARALNLLSIRLARHWLLTLIVSLLAVFATSYFYFTSVHALESFDTGSCTPLTLDSSGPCVARLQVLLNDDQAYPAVVADGSFGPQTEQAVIDFQSANHLSADGVVAGETANAINELAPRPGIFSYVAGFVNSQLALSAKLMVAAFMVAVAIVCLLLRAARAGVSSLLRIRCALAGLFAALIAANSAALETLMAEAHGWVTKFICVILAALTAALLRLLTEMFPRISALSALAEPPPRETQPRLEGRLWTLTGGPILRPAAGGSGHPRWLLRRGGCRRRSRRRPGGSPRTVDRGEGCGGGCGWCWPGWPSCASAPTWPRRLTSSA